MPLFILYPGHLYLARRGVRPGPAPAADGGAAHAACAHPRGAVDAQPGLAAAYVAFALRVRAMGFSSVGSSPSSSLRVSSGAAPTVTMAQTALKMR